MLRILYFVYVMGCVLPTTGAVLLTVTLHREFIKNVEFRQTNMLTCQPVVIKTTEIIKQSTSPREDPSASQRFASNMPDRSPNISYIIRQSKHLLRIGQQSSASVVTAKAEMHSLAVMILICFVQYAVVVVLMPYDKRKISNYFPSDISLDFKYIWKTLCGDFT